MYYSLLRSVLEYASVVFANLTPSLHGGRKGAKENPTYHLWSRLEQQGSPRACRATVPRGRTANL